MLGMHATRLMGVGCEGGLSALLMVPCCCQVLLSSTNQRQIRDGDKPLQCCVPQIVHALTRRYTPLTCRADRSYVITGGLGGFGLALAVWLANRGARAFVLTSKRGLRTGGQRKVIELLRSRGCKVRACCCLHACSACKTVMVELTR